MLINADIPTHVGRPKPEMLYFLEHFCRTRLKAGSGFWRVEPEDRLCGKFFRTMGPAEREAARKRMLAGQPSENFSEGQSCGKFYPTMGPAEREAARRRHAVRSEKFSEVNEAARDRMRTRTKTGYGKFTDPAPAHFRRCKIYSDGWQILTFPHARGAAETGNALFFRAFLSHPASGPGRD